LARRLEIHYTPKHGSWLSVAEIELSALNSQCLYRRIPHIGLMSKEVAAWEFDRNNRVANIEASTPPRKTPREPKPADLANTDALNAALRATPDVGAEQVARAKALIQDPCYPSAKVVDQVAGV
jgi:hypothetical protein